jgi:hypothetical protein
MATHEIAVSDTGQPLGPLAERGWFRRWRRKLYAVASGAVHPQVATTVRNTSTLTAGRDRETTQRTVVITAFGGGRKKKTPGENAEG